MLRTIWGGRGLRPAGVLAAAAILTVVGFSTGTASASSCYASNVTTDYGKSAHSCFDSLPTKHVPFWDKIDNVDSGNRKGDYFSIYVTDHKKGGDAIGGTWSLLPGMSFAKEAKYALELKGGPRSVFYHLDTSNTSGTWSTADLLVGKKDRQAGLSYIKMVGSAAPVPLPAAAWLLIGGVAGLGALAKRRRASA